MRGCQNYGPFLGTLNNRCRITTGTQKGAIILTTTHIGIMERQMETTMVYCSCCGLLSSTYYLRVKIRGTSARWGFVRIFKHVRIPDGDWDKFPFRTLTFLGM